jgi:hypothetical protein
MDSQIGKNCKKEVTVIKYPKPSIEIVKYSGNPNDLD